MNEMVQYNNTLNSLQFKGFTAMDYNILMGLCYKVRDKGHAKIVVPFDELKKLTDFQKQSDTLFIKDLERMIDKLMKVSATHITGDIKTYFVLFPTFEIDNKARTLTVRVNKDFAFILNELTDNFTKFELKEFAELESKYAKSLYKNLKQYKKTGWWKPTVEELRMVLDVPESYSNKRVMGDVLKPALKLLDGKFENLKCEPIRAQKKGAPIERYYFTFRAEKQIPGQQTIADYPGVLPGEAPTKGRGKKTNYKIESGPSTPQTKEEWEELERKLIEN